MENCFIRGLPTNSLDNELFSNDRLIITYRIFGLRNLQCIRVKMGAKYPKKLKIAHDRLKTERFF